MTIQLLAVGALGNMLSPSVNHLQNITEAQIKTVVVRNTQGELRQERLRAWEAYGANIAHTLSEVDYGALDGVIICAGKNGDDLPLIAELVAKFPKNTTEPPFILHCSTVSPVFARYAQEFCQQHGVVYLNTPLTGGVTGANKATMLILASGNLAVYQRLEPLLKHLGNPVYFNEISDTSACVKLISHCLVFNGLSGVCSASNLYTEVFDTTLTNTNCVDFFDFLNQGAGGTNQWTNCLRMGVAKDQWQDGFLIKHAVIDALYTSQLAINRTLPLPAILPLLTMSLSLAFAHNQTADDNLATQFLAPCFNQYRAALDEFIADHLNPRDPVKTLTQCLSSLPESMQRAAALNICLSDFTTTFSNIYPENAQ